MYVCGVSVTLNGDVSAILADDVNGSKQVVYWDDYCLGCLFGFEDIQFEEVDYVKTTYDNNGGVSIVKTDQFNQLSNILLKTGGVYVGIIPIAGDKYLLIKDLNYFEADIIERKLCMEVDSTPHTIYAGKVDSATLEVDDDLYEEAAEFFSLGGV